MAKRTHGTRGAFGGLYNHQLIKQMRSELAKTKLVLAALVEHTKISQPELNRIAVAYFQRKEMELAQRETPKSD